MGIQKSVKHLKTLATKKEDAEKSIVKEDCTWMCVNFSWEENVKKEQCKWFHPKSLTQHESDHKSGKNVVAHALLEMGKMLALLMQEHNKANTGETARGNP